MTHDLGHLAHQCREILRGGDTPATREQVAQLLSQALRDRAFVASQFEADAPERRIAYEDPEMGFCIVAHEYRGAKEGAPHDHGPSWAIYGQAEGETLMTDYEVLQRATPQAAGKVRKTRSYRMQPGDTHVYNEGDVHAPARKGPTRLIRVEGVNMDTVQRLRFESVESA